MTERKPGKLKGKDLTPFHARYMAGESSDLVARDLGVTVQFLEHA